MKSAVGTNPKRLKDEIHELQDENERLRTLLSMDSAEDDTWGFGASQELKDQMAARALFAEHLDPFRALRRLGFKFEGTADQKERILRIFGTPGVRELLHANTRDAEANRSDIVGRLVQIALHADAERSVRAIEQLSRICGWGNKTKALPNMNILQVYAGNGSTTQRRALPHETDIVDAGTLLSHEPEKLGTAIMDDE